jgi:Cdc6-like AAA superfamily ATPase
MSIRGIDEDKFGATLKSRLTPSTSIKTPERLYGRDKYLSTMARSLNSTGRQIFVYGDRGVGKTSLALTAAQVHTASERKPIYVVCENESTFATVIQAVANSTIKVEDRIEKPSIGQSAGFNIMGNGITINKGTPRTASIPPPASINDALDLIRYVTAKGSGRQIVVIDEMERINSQIERVKFAEFIKNLGEIDEDISFVFCGIASDLNDIIGGHPSAGRILEPVKLDRLHHSDLWKIITSVTEALGISIDREYLIRIGQISDGFPHFVHLIGESMFWSMQESAEELEKVRIDDFSAGVNGALERAEPTLKVQYDKATKKTRLTEDYEEVLWALADTTADSRQVFEIYNTSYRRVMHGRPKRRELSREQFNQRLLSLKSTGHGEILSWTGAGWYGFREKMMRGYARLNAQYAGIELGKDAV